MSLRRNRVSEVLDEENYDRRKSGSRKRRRSTKLIHEDSDEDDYGDEGGRGSAGLKFIDDEALVDDDEEDEVDKDEEDDDFIDNGAADLPDELDSRPPHHRQFLPDDEEENIDAFERSIRARYENLSTYPTYDEEVINHVEQQALLPSIRDPKLWMVKCVIGREREVAACLMQKCIDKRGELKIRSVIALDHLQNYVYVEAEKEAHVIEACKGMRYIFSGTKFVLVPNKEMTGVLSVESRKVEISRDAWVRIKIGAYKGDLAKVVNVDNVRQRVTVKLVPRIDLQALVDKLEGREVSRNAAITPPPRFMNVEKATAMGIRVRRSRDPLTGDCFDVVEGMKFKDGFMYKTVSVKAVSTKDIQPTFEEFENFTMPGDNGDGYTSDLSSRKKGQCMKGDRVVIVTGDLKNLKGVVEKVEENTVHIKPYDNGLPKTVAVSKEEVCKYFEPGSYVKVLSGANEGTTGMVLEVERNMVRVLSDTTKEVIRVYSDQVVESSEIGKSHENNDSNLNQRITTPQYGCRKLVGVPEINTGGKLRGGNRGHHNSLIGTSIIVRVGNYKGCRGIVKNVKGSSIDVELESQMKIIKVQRDQITGSANSVKSFSATPLYGAGRTPMRPHMTPLRDCGSATPIHDGMRTPKRDKAWNPYSPVY